MFEDPHFLSNVSKSHWVLNCSSPHFFFKTNFHHPSAYLSSVFTISSVARRQVNIKTQSFLCFGTNLNRGWLHPRGPVTWYLQSVLGWYCWKQLWSWCRHWRTLSVIFNRNSSLHPLKPIFFENFCFSHGQEDVLSNVLFFWETLLLLFYGCLFYIFSILNLLFIMFI